MAELGSQCGDARAAEVLYLTLLHCSPRLCCRRGQLQTHYVGTHFCFVCVLVLVVCPFPRDSCLLWSVR